MQCKFVRESMCMSYTFHPKSISLFSLVHFKNRLRIIQQNLYTGLIMNDFPIPLRQQKLQVDNYTVCYNEKLDIIIFTLSNRILIYSLQKKILLVVVQATNKNSPLYITRTATRGTNLFFSATQQKVVFGINIQQCIKNASISNYVKYKISANQAQINEITISDKILVALCNDRVLRIWDIQSSNPLKGVAIQNVGRPICFNFSKNDKYLILGTSDGFVQVWDGQTLGVRNIKMMSQKITKNIVIQSICWFHYAGQSHSFRFLVLTVDGNVKLYSFWFEKKEDSYIGRCTQLSLLYNCRQEIGQNFMIKAHSFANFVFFTPGILLYMVDSHSLIYYPVVMKQPSASFDQLTPNKKKQIYYTRDILFMKGMQIKRLKDTIQDKIYLQDDLEYKQLKILRLDMRPWSNQSAPQMSKLMVVYYLKNTIRVITLSKLNLNQKIEDIASYKEYSGSWIMFLGPKQYYQPLLLIVQEDKQTVTIIAQNPSHPHDLKLATQQQKKYMNMGPGQIYTNKINIKIQKVYPTPFRNGYVVLYQTDNLLRFSNNVNFQQDLMNYEVCPGMSSRLNYDDIILDVIWTTGGELGAVICLDKVEIINASLMSIRKFLVSGYIVQGQWIGYTLLITTKKDVQYCDIISKPIQAFCLQNLQSKYLVMRVMADRIIGAEKSIDGTVTVKARYFKIMQPLISGYLNYQYIAQLPIDQQKIKMIIQCFAPYFIVSEQFISLLNEKNLSSISKYFLQGNQKMYSKPLRAKTLNNRLKIQRFIPEQVWNKNKRILLDLYLSYEQSKDSNDPYEVQIGKQYANKIKGIVGSIAFDSIKDLSTTEGVKGVTINNNFGQQSMYQLYHDFNKQGQHVKMQIYPFKAQNCGEWLGQFGLYLQSKPYFDEQEQINQPNSANNVRKNMMQHQQSQDQQEDSGEDDENPFKNLVVYYRCDDGKGQTVEDLSNYNNNGTISQQSIWIPLQEQPMQLQDKWGKKCPPQFSLNTPIVLAKKLNTKIFFKLTIQLWIKPQKQDFCIVKMGKQFEIDCKKLHLEIKLNGVVAKFQAVSQGKISVDSWAHFAVVINPKQNIMFVYLNSELLYQNKQPNIKIPKIPSGLEIGDPNNSLEYTQFRLWRKAQQQQQIKQNMRTPLELVSEKRKRLRAKLKQKKKKSTNQESGVNPFSLD